LGAIWGTEKNRYKKGILIKEEELRSIKLFFQKTTRIYKQRTRWCRGQKNRAKRGKPRAAKNASMRGGKGESAALCGECFEKNKRSSKTTGARTSYLRGIKEVPKKRKEKQEGLGCKRAKDRNRVDKETNGEAKSSQLQQMF